MVYFVFISLLGLTEDTSWEPSESHSDMLNGIDTSPINSLGKFGQADPLMISYEPRNLSIRVFINDSITICSAAKGLIPRAIHTGSIGFRCRFLAQFWWRMSQSEPYFEPVKTSGRRYSIWNPSDSRMAQTHYAGLKKKWFSVIGLLNRRILHFTMKLLMNVYFSRWCDLTWAPLKRL